MPVINDILRTGHFEKVPLRKQLLSIVVSLLFGTTGLYLFISYFFTPLMDSSRAKDWIQIDATLLTLDSTIGLQLEYRYEYNNKHYISNNVSFSDRVTPYSREYIQDLDNNYPINSLIPIWINPSNPKESTFDRKIHLFNWTALFMSLPLLTIGMWKLTDLLTQGSVYRIRKKASKDAATVASQYSAHDISSAILNNQRDLGPPIISYLKHSNLLGFYFFTLYILYLNCLMSISLTIVTITRPFFPHNLQYLFIFAIAFSFIAFSFIYPLFKSRPFKKSEDYVIVSTYDESLNNITHQWLLLSRQSEMLEIGMQTTTSERNEPSLKKFLKNSPYRDIYKTPNKAIFQGSITHKIEKTNARWYKLLVYTKNLTTGAYNQHEIFIPKTTTKTNNRQS